MQPEMWLSRRGSPGDPKIVNFNVKGKFLSQSNLSPARAQTRQKSA